MNLKNFFLMFIIFGFLFFVFFGIRCSRVKRALVHIEVIEQILYCENRRVSKNKTQLQINTKKRCVVLQSRPFVIVVLYG